MDTYRERLVAPLSWWILAVAFGVICGWLMLVATNQSVAIGTTVVATGVAAILVWSYGSVVVEAGPHGFRVGPAHLPSAHIGAVEVLDARGFREQLGPHADARAWLQTRPYIEAGVRVEVADTSDPTPYWLVSTRRPQALAAALRQTGVAPIRNGEVEGGQEEEV